MAGVGPVMRQRAEHKPWIHMGGCDGGWFQSADGTRHSAKALGEGGFVALTYNVWMAREHEEVRWAALFDIVDRSDHPNPTPPFLHPIDSS